MDASFFGDIFSRLAALSDKWRAEQKKSEALFTALLEFHGRLVNMTSDDPFEPLSDFHRKTFEAALPLLRAKHVRGLENILASLRRSLDRFKALRAEMGELHASVWQRHSMVASDPQQAPSLDVPSWGVVGAGRGSDAQPVGLPAPNTCIEWVAEIDRMYASELLVKLELLDAVDLGLQGEVLQGLYRLWSLQIHVKPAVLERLTVLADSLTLPEGGVAV